MNNKKSLEIKEEKGVIKNDNNKQDNEYCECGVVASMYADTESSDFGYWDLCSKCNKKIRDSFHYYDHYDGEDHDDIDLYS